MPDLLDFIGSESRSVQERFDAFHRAHPEVLAKLVELARAVKRTGLKRCGISLLWERARWYWTFERTADEGEYKLDNYLRSRYVRLMIETYPDEFDGFFELRQLKAK